ESSGDRFETFGEAAGVAFLGPGQRLEPFRDLRETFVTRRTGEAGVHLGVLVRLAGDRGPEIVLGRPYRLAGDGVAHAGQEVEVPEGVTGLAFGDRAEQRGNIGIALDVGLLGEVQVPAVGLALGRERVL